MSKTDVLALQHQTNRFYHAAGFRPIAVDGVVGGETLNAVPRVARYILANTPALTLAAKPGDTTLLTVTTTTNKSGIESRAGTLALLFKARADGYGFLAIPPPNGPSSTSASSGSGGVSVNTSGSGRVAPPPEFDYAGVPSGSGGGNALGFVIVLGLAGWFFWGATHGSGGAPRRRRRRR